MAAATIVRDTLRARRFVQRRLDWDNDDIAGTGQWTAERRKLTPSFLPFLARAIKQDIHDFRTRNENGDRILSAKDFLFAYIPTADPIKVPWLRNGKAIQRSYSHNLRTTVGIDFLGYAAFGQPAATQGYTGTATSAPGATGWVDSGAAYPTTNQKLIGRRVVFAGVFGNITANTATGGTVDQWHPMNIPQQVAAASTPGNGATYYISDEMGPAYFLALSSSSGLTPAAGDTTLASEISSNGLGRVACPIAHTYGAATFTFTTTFTATGAQSAYGAGIFTAISNGVLVLEGTFTGATLASGDALVPSWVVTVS